VPVTVTHGDGRGALTARRERSPHPLRRERHVEGAHA
jgi:hypothetical protein